MRPSTVLIAPLALVLAACTDSTTLTGPHPVSAVRDVLGASTQNATTEPFSASCVSEDVQPPGFIYPYFLDQVIAGTCQVTHLGQSSMSMRQYVNLRTGDATASVTFTAPNGDALTFTQSTGSADIGPGLKSFTGTATITGGSGRFASARGTWDLEGTLSLDQQGIGHALSTYTGWIAYDASDRSEK
jgi:hypothetical protein